MPLLPGYTCTISSCHAESKGNTSITRQQREWTWCKLARLGAGHDSLGSPPAIHGAWTGGPSSSGSKSGMASAPCASDMVSRRHACACVAAVVHSFVQCAVRRRRRGGCAFRIGVFRHGACTQQHLCDQWAHFKVLLVRPGRHRTCLHGKLFVFLAEVGGRVMQSVCVQHSRGNVHLCSALVTMAHNTLPLGQMWSDCDVR